MTTNEKLATLRLLGWDVELEETFAIVNTNMGTMRDDKVFLDRPNFESWDLPKIMRETLESVRNTAWESGVDAGRM